MLAIIARWMPDPRRTWATIAGLSAVIVFWTMAFFVPILQKTQISAGAGLSGEEITTLVRRFWTWQWGRWVVLIGGWLCGLQALRLSPSPPSVR